MTSTKEPVKNVDLWKRLDELVAHHRVTWKWVKGHAGNADNERCDGLAGREIAKLKQQYSKADRQAALEAFKNPNAPKHIFTLSEAANTDALELPPQATVHKPKVATPSLVPVETRTLKQASLF